MVSLEWEENVFLGLKSIYKAIFTSPTERAIVRRQALLVDHKGAILLIGKMLSGRDIRILETEDRLLYANDRICLPKRVHLGTSESINGECFLLRSVAAAISIRFGLHAGNADQECMLAYCANELPRFMQRLNALKEELLDPDLIAQIFPRLPTLAELGSEKIKGLEFSGVESQTQASAPTEVEGQGRVQVVDVTEGESGSQDVPFHTFEKAETLDEYSGLSRQHDAEDELADHEEALSQLKMDSVIRTADRSQSLYRADIMLDGLGLEVRSSISAGVPYPEWDYQKRAYRENWCFVQERLADQADLGWAERMRGEHGSLIETLKKQFATLASDIVRIKRQPSGDEFDLDQLTELLVRLKTKETPSENLYLGIRRQLLQVATLILVDSSYSTDSWVENRCVLDVMKTSVFCLSEVLDDIDQQFGIFSFASNTRQSCRMEIIKQFEEPWRIAAGRVGKIVPMGYTRIGPALRHAYHLLANIPAEKKLVILITDGKPCDYDRYEGRYGIEDIKKALSEGKLLNVTTHAFAVDKQARFYFPAMFSSADYDVVTHPSKLLSSIFQMYLKLIRCT